MTPCFHCMEHGFSPQWAAKIPHAVWYGQNNNNKHMLKKVSSNRNKILYSSVDENVMRGLWELNPVFPLRTLVQYLLIQCPQQFCRA